MKEKLKQIIKQNGACWNIDCKECYFSPTKINTSCGDAGFSTEELDRTTEDKKLKKSAKKALKELKKNEAIRNTQIFNK